MVSPSAISTKPNETFFSLFRNLVVKPNPLEFAMTAPTIIIEMVKQVTDLPFLYETKDHPFYEASKHFLPVGCIPQIPMQNQVKLTEQEYQIKNDYLRCYLQGVRQLSIRQQNTKNKAGTLPLYIYKKDSNHGQ